MTADQTAPPALPAEYPEPLWVRAKAVLRARIEGGELQAGARLPPERELCRLLAISRVTLRKALQPSSTRAYCGPPTAGAGTSPAPNATTGPTRLESFCETARRMASCPPPGCCAANSGHRPTTRPRPSRSHPARRCTAWTGCGCSTRYRSRWTSRCIPAGHRRRVRRDRLHEPLALRELIAGLGFRLAQAEATIEARAADAELAGHLDIAAGHTRAGDASGRPRPGPAPAALLHHPLRGRPLPAAHLLHTERRCLSPGALRCPNLPRMRSPRDLIGPSACRPVPGSASPRPDEIAASTAIAQAGGSARPRRPGLLLRPRSSRTSVNSSPATSGPAAFA